MFGDGQLELPWRFPSPYAPILPLGPDARPIPLEMDHNARYAMGLPSHHGKNYRHDDEDVDDGDAATITPTTCHREEHRRGDHDAGPGTKHPTYHTPVTPAEENSGRGVFDHAVHHSLDMLKTRDTSPLTSAAVAYRQSDPFVEKNPPVRPLQQQPRAPTPTALAYGLGPADARLQLPSQRFAVGDGGVDPTPTRPATASRAPTHASLLGGEPGPDMGPAAQRRATPQDLHHFVGFDGVGGGTEDRGRPSSHHHHRSRSSGDTTTPPSPLSVSPLSLSSRRVTGSVATVRDLRAMAPPHRQISIRSLVPASSAGGRGDRQIIVTNALNHILYNGPCRHCEVNHCVCLLPASATPSSPQGMPANAHNDNSDPATLFGTAVPRPQHQPPDNGIMTEGFCRHCVVNHCACVSDAKWGLHHAANALRNARLDENHRQHHDDPTARRLVSDSGTVRRYESTSIEAADDNGDRDVTTGSHCALRTGSNSALPPPFAAPLPAYLPLGRERISSGDGGGGCGFYDLEAQPHRRDGSSGESGSGRGMVSTFHFRHSIRPGGTDPGVLGVRRTRTRRSRVAGFVTGHLCRIFVAVIFILLIVVIAWVVWFYTNRNGVPIL